MRVFCISMDCDGCDDSFYFDNLPSKGDVLAAIKANADLAPEYDWFYKALTTAAELFDWPQYWSSNMSEIGKKGDSDVYIRIKRCNVIGVKKIS